MSQSLRQEQLAPVTPIHSWDTAKVAEVTPAPSRVDLRIVALMQSMVEGHELTYHRSYMLTSYDDDGYYIHLQLNEREKPITDILPEAAARKEQLFPNGIPLVNYGVVHSLTETELADARKQQEALLLSWTPAAKHDEPLAEGIVIELHVPAAH